MRCASCDVVFHARADARFCSGTCRVRAHRAGRPPLELVSRDRWVTHRAKVPLQADGRTASSTDPATWTSFDQVTACKGRDGVGFVLNGDGIACVDLDHCLVDGVLEPWAQQIVDRCPRTYVEISPSGTGLHVFGLATVGVGRNMRGVEVYDRGRYMTVTGRRFGSFPARLADISGLIASL